MAKIGMGLGYAAPWNFGTPSYFYNRWIHTTSTLVYTTWVWACQKQLLGPKLAAVWVRGSSPKIWDPYLYWNSKNHFLFEPYFWPPYSYICSNQPV